MRTRTAISGGLGVVALALGAIYTFEPALATQLPGLSLVETRLDDTDPNHLLTTVGGVLSLYALLGAWAGSITPTKPAASSTSRYDGAQEHPPERVIDDNRTPVTEAVPSTLDATTLTEDETAEARTLLRDTTEALIATADAIPEDALANGAWTESQLAAAFLSDAAGVEYSVWSRLRRWLDPEREHARRVRVTAREVDAFAATLKEEDAE